MVLFFKLLFQDSCTQQASPQSPWAVELCQGLTWTAAHSARSEKWCGVRLSGASRARSPGRPWQSSSRCHGHPQLLTLPPWVRIGHKAQRREVEKIKFVGILNIFGNTNRKICTHTGAVVTGAVMPSWSCDTWGMAAAHSGQGCQEGTGVSRARAEAGGVARCRCVALGCHGRRWRCSLGCERAHYTAWEQQRFGPQVSGHGSG